MLVTVASFRDPWEAQLFRSRLEAEGIVALVAHQNHIGMNWAYSTALGGVKVQVPDAELAGVREVVARCRAGGFRDDLLAVFGDLDDPRCPRCGLLHFERRRPYPQVLLAPGAVPGLRRADPALEMAPPLPELWRLLAGLSPAVASLF